MKKLVIIPGGFHPYHAGHKALYDAAVEAFPTADVYVAATADTSQRPFPFELKQKLARLAGVPAHRFIQVRSPFRAEEITQHYDPETTQLIFVRSDKDQNNQPRPGGTKRDGSPAYLQPYRRNGLQAMNQHGYMAYLPTVQFGPGMTSATEIRAKWPDMSDEQKQDLIHSMYPQTLTSAELTSVVIKMLDSVMAPKVQEAVLINDPEQGHLIQPDGGMGTWDEDSLRSNLTRKFADMLDMVKQKQYRSLHHVLYEAGVIENIIKALREYDAFQQKQGARALARGRVVDLEDYLDENQPR